MTEDQKWLAEAMIMRCLAPHSPAEQILVLGDLIGRYIATVPPENRAFGRGAMIEIIDKATADAAIGEPVGRG